MSDEKVIDFEPSSKSSNRLYWMVSSALFAVTWIVIAVMWVSLDSDQGKVVISSDKELAERVENLKEQLDGLKESIEQQKTTISLVEPPAELPDQGVVASVQPDVSTMEIDAVTQDEFNVIADKIVKLESELEKVAGLEQELQKLADIEKNGVNAEYGPMIMALVQVQDQVRKGLPFGAELKLLKFHSNEDPVLQQHLSVLGAHGENGVASADSLRDGFIRIAPNVVSAVKKSDRDDLWSRAKNRMFDIVSIRKLDDNGGDSVEAVVTRAEMALKKYNITEAVLELDTLDERAKEVLANWLASASSRVAVEYALDGMIDRITQNSAKQKP